ncbi:serine/threonine protein kinase [Nonomuraea harbinensis]|uniref:Serine/threonine protein kinase n=1 Tax=Nonomuraea harbinensis TaxID=1286938 RepID=A0ABW1C5T4_9ACTN|nr:serine/threonine-protein kinase [Nonomuraea harbinensis]
MSDETTAMPHQQPGMPSARGAEDSLAPLGQHDPVVMGPYRLVGRLGAGGMGVVFAGVDSAGRRAAVKVIHAELAHDDEFRVRFRREIDLLRRVRARCMVQVLGADAEAEQPWLATEYVPGPTLAQRVEQNGPLSEQEIVGLAGGLGEALRAMHTVGVVHRDLKPSNVILSPTGPRLIDMGIARAMDETSVTRTGVLVGSPGWISPEEYRGSDVGPAADVYGWALLVLFAATGRPPFGTGRPEVLAMRVLADTPDVEAVPEPLKDLARRSLAKQPSERPSAEDVLNALVQGWRESAVGQTAGDVTLVEEVTRYLDRTWVMPLTNNSNWIVPAPPSRSGARRWGMVAGGLGVVGAVAAAAALFINGGAGEPQAPAAVRTDRTAVPAPTSSSAPQTKASSATPSPTKEATSSPKPSSLGKKVTMIRGHSFVLPSDWLYFPDNTNNTEGMCLRPKRMKDADYLFCSQFGMSIHPWLSTGSGASEDDDLSWLEDADGLNYTYSGEGPCISGHTSRKGEIVKGGLNKIGNLRAHYRKARSYCDDGSTRETETLVLPITGLTIVIDKLPAEERAQAEDILRSFKFAKKQTR